MNMTINQIKLSLLDALEQIGDARDLRKWTDGQPNYVADLHLYPEHIPALIQIAQQWAEPFEQTEGKSDTAWAAPIHAWRALGQLRAVEAVEPLLAMLNRMDEIGDDWYLEEFHKVFGMIGPSALEPLAHYVVDQSNAEFPRISAATGLNEIAERHGETRDQVVKILTDELAKQAPDIESLNGFLADYLIKLRAVESAEVIERAYAAEVIDPHIRGTWTQMRRELGVEGLGLVTEENERKMEPLFNMDRLDLFGQKQANQRQRMRKRKVKEKRKQRRKSRKQNRNR